MAGLGSRFADNGYLLPKPLIPVSGQPMILRAIEGLPAADKWIFIVRQEHIDEYQIDELLKSAVPGAIVIPVAETTEGQACTVMLARPYLKPDDEVFIAACDNTFVYDHTRYETLLVDPTVDSIVWTFTERESLRESPKSYGWIKLDPDGQTIDDMSVKVPVSDDPYHDHAVVATFYFRRASDLEEAYDLMVKENYRINNEFYADSLPIFMKKLGKKSVIFDVELCVLWGRPAELYLYDQNEYRFLHQAGEKLDDSWLSYFKNLK
jgi:NDP-sugar pyrophosphorylase family protein